MQPPTQGSDHERRWTEQPNVHDVEERLVKEMVRAGRKARGREP